MARLRTLKPSFFTNEDLAAIAPLGRLLFAGLWGIADREGRLEDRPARIKISVLPYDDCDVDALLAELDRRGFIKRYAVDDDRFIQVVKFAQHQRPNAKEVDSVIPPPPGDVPVETTAAPSIKEDPPSTKKIVSDTKKTRTSMLRKPSSVNGDSVNGVSVNGSGAGERTECATPAVHERADRAPPARRDTHLSEQFLDALTTEYAPRLGGEASVRKAIKKALNNRQSKGWLNAEQGLRAWLDDDVANRGAADTGREPAAAAAFVGAAGASRGGARPPGRALQPGDWGPDAFRA